jgi:3-hydroxyacyl-CoA dehydrogenase/enoyl-CoA hydratase/3-hydroxybutyryl-CoA epimerase
MGQYFAETVEAGVRVVRFNRSDKDANTLGEAVLLELSRILDAIKNDASTTAVIFTSGRQDQFIAGADIEDIAKFTTAGEAEAGSQAMQDVLNKISHLGKPTVAAIQGACLGGGLELALACTWRIAANDEKTKLGLPEIQLGFIPGAGGTQRLPRLIGIAPALDLILTAKRIDGTRSLKLGLVDACVPPQILMNEAMGYARKSQAKTTLKRSLGQIALEGNLIGRRVMAIKARQEVAKNTKGHYPAPYRALEAVFLGYEMSLDKGLALEARLFGELTQTSVSKSLVHLFHASNAVKKHAYRDAGKERFGDSIQVSSIGVIGGGFMGAGISTVCADRGLRVFVSDPNRDSLAKMLKQAREFFDKKVRRRRLKSFEADSKLAQITPQLSPSGFNQCDIVVESVVENLDVKRQIIATTEVGCHKDWIFASNTSAIPLSQIGSNSHSPERVVGMHFFSPVEKMPLLEVVVAEKTAPWAVARAAAVGAQLGKTVIIVKDSPGFYVNRALAFYLVEAAIMVGEGVAIDYLDETLVNFGWPVGPINLIDEVGIDIGMHVLKTMESAWPQRFKVPSQFASIAASGRLGRKNGKGFYLYPEGKKGAVDAEIYSIIQTKPRRDLAQDEMIDRCVLGYINESMLCLEDGVIASPNEGDIGSVFGVGFPPFLGGPFKYIDSCGPTNILDRMRKLQARYGDRFVPAKTLETMAASNKKFFASES